MTHLFLISLIYWVRLGVGVTVTTAIVLVLLLVLVLNLELVITDYCIRLSSTKS